MHLAESPSTACTCPSPAGPCRFFCLSIVPRARTADRDETLPVIAASPPECQLVRGQHAPARSAGDPVRTVTKGRRQRPAGRMLLGIRQQGSRDGTDETLRAELGPRRRPGRPDLPVASQVRSLRPGMGRAGATPEPLRTMEAAVMRQRQPAGGADRARRVIRQKNIRESKGEPYENRTHSGFWPPSLTAPHGRG